MLQILIVLHSISIPTMNKLYSFSLLVDNNEQYQRPSRCPSNRANTCSSAAVSSIANMSTRVRVGLAFSARWRQAAEVSLKSIITPSQPSMRCLKAFNARAHSSMPSSVSSLLPSRSSLYREFRPERSRNPVPVKSSVYNLKHSRLTKLPNADNESSSNEYVEVRCSVRKLTRLDRSQNRSTIQPSMVLRSTYVKEVRPEIALMSQIKSRMVMSLMMDKDRQTEGVRQTDKWRGRCRRVT